MDPAFVSHEESTSKPQLVSEEQQQYQQHMRQQPSTSSSVEKSVGESPPSNTATPPLVSKHPKLDGVLYHFYSKTLAVITNCRLTHYDASDLTYTTSTPSTPLIESPSNTIRSGPASTSSAMRRTNKWFELEIADYDIFREEVRLWRNISAMIPASVLEGPSSDFKTSDPSYVPPMILDIILDTSSLSEKHLLMMDQVDLEGSRDKKRVRVDGKDWGTGPNSRRNSIGKSKEEQDNEQLDSHRKPIVLETWKLTLGACNPLDPPDLPTLYRHATANLKELFSLSKQLPAYSMYSRFHKAKVSLKQGISEEGNEVDLLKIGVRLRVEDDKPGEETREDDGICPVQEILGPMSKSRSSDTSKVTEIFSFQPLLTPIGTINFSVEYRLDAEFYVEDLEASKNLRDIELDEDYFRPGMNKSNLKPPTKTAAVIPRSPLSGPRSLPSSTSDRRQSIIASETNYERGAATPSPPSEIISRSPGPTPTSSTSVFSTSASSGKPVAGLASLRRSPSITAGHSTSPTTTMTPISVPTGIASSPATSNMSATDAAFLTHGRRASTSERRIRTLSSMSGSGSGSGDKASPPIAAANSISPSPYQPSSRPILARSGGSALPSLRSGSYSPSSPSPLAQQLSAHQQTAVIAPQSSSRISSSPSFRTASLPFSCSPNLRSVFQSYTPSQSQTSISSFSRTPPKSITEGTSAANNSSLGLQGDNQNSPSQSSLAEGRKPSVAPQMIKRYSSTFNYRQGRQAASTVGGGGGAVGSSLESEGSGGGGPYSKSWQARIEQRQMFTARSLGREEGSHLSGSSGGGGHFFSSSFSPRIQRRSIGTSASQEDDLDDFVKMIESSHPEEPNSSNSTTSQAGGTSLEGTARRSSMTSYTTASSGVGFNRQYSLNRNRVDEMLSKMQSSVRGFSTSTTSRGSGGASGASVGAVTSSPSSGGSNQSSAGAANIDAGSDNNSPQSNPGGLPFTVSSSFARSPLSKVGFSAATAAGAGLSEKKALAGIPSASVQRPQAVERQAPPYRYDLPARREMHTQAVAATDKRQEEGSKLTTSLVREEDEDEDEEDGATPRHSRRPTSGGSLEMYANQPHSYDPLEDEAVGRLELVQDDLQNEGGGRSDAVSGSGAHHHHHHHHHHHSVDVNTSGAAERRRADIEMARNFGQVVSSSSNRGNPRASLSPWRNRIPNQHSNTSNRGGNGASTGGNGNGSSTG